MSAHRIPLEVLHGCSPFKAVRELGSERRETVRSLSPVGEEEGGCPKYERTADGTSGVRVVNQ